MRERHFLQFLLVLLIIVLVLPASAFDKGGKKKPKPEPPSEDTPVCVSFSGSINDDQDGGYCHGEGMRVVLQDGTGDLYIDLRGTDGIRFYKFEWDVPTESGPEYSCGDFYSTGAFVNIDRVGVVPITEGISDDNWMDFCTRSEDSYEGGNLCVSDGDEHWVLRRATFYVDDQPKNGETYMLRFQSPSGEDLELIHTAYLKVQKTAEGIYYISPETEYDVNSNLDFQPEPPVQLDTRYGKVGGMDLILRGWKGGICAYYWMDFLATVTPAPQ
jgi:hypothetical protein